MAIRFFATKCKILQLYPHGHSLFYSEMQNFETLPKQPFRFFYNERQNFKNCTQTAIRFLQRNTEFWKLHPNGHSYFPHGNQKPTIYHQFFQASFLKNGKKIKIWFRDILLNLIHKKVYKNIDYRKLVPSLYNGFLKPVVYCRENHCKKVSPQFFSVLCTNINIF